MTKFGSYATNSSAIKINLDFEFASFVAGEIIQVLEAMPGSVVPLAMFILKVCNLFDNLLKLIKS